jgi:hypothetical protein
VPRDALSRVELESSLGLVFPGSLRQALDDAQREPHLITKLAIEEAIAS